MTYRKLKNMLAKANEKHDNAWDKRQYNEAIRYTKIGLRLLQSIGKYKTNFYA